MGLHKTMTINSKGESAFFFKTMYLLIRVQLLGSFILTCRVVLSVKAANDFCLVEKIAPKLKVVLPCRTPNQFCTIIW